MIPPGRLLHERLEARVRGYGAGRAVVALSGGVDSAVVLAVAASAVGAERVTAVTAVSPSYPKGELGSARGVARSLGVPHRTVRTREVEREDYARNDELRCFHCKTELYSVLEGLARTATRETVVLAGANADDVRDFRPGLAAGRQRGVRNPLLEEGLGKPAVRAVAACLGLAVADKPALACLSSRVAFGIPITSELLRRVDRAERSVRALGFRQVRVRHHGDDATIEVEPEAVARLRGHPGLERLLDTLRGLGWRDVQVDPAGYRPGAMNPPPSSVLLYPRPLQGTGNGGQAADR